MKWIQSNGGPLALVPESTLESWRGVLELPGNASSHYDLACSVADDIAVLRLQAMEVLVLGDEHFQTTWISCENGGLLVRWIYSDGEQPIYDYLESGDLGKILQSSGIAFHTPGSCILFDSAEPGADIRGSTLRAPLSSGHYEIRTALANPSPTLRLLVHQLVRMTNSP
jgi:hypothetical protein